MTIIIAGAGIGGLAAALSLHAAGRRDILVLEAASALRPLGVGINVLPHAVRELTELGLGDALARMGVETAELAYCDTQGALIWAEPRGREAGYRWPQYSIHRGALQMLLLDVVRERLGAASVRTGCRVDYFEETPGGTLLVRGRDLAGAAFAEPASVLIGADGIRSAIRALLVPGHAPLAWNGWVMYRGASWSPPYRSGRSMVIIGDDAQRAVVYPIGPARAEDGLVWTNWILSRPAEAALDRGNWNSGIAAAAVERFAEGWSYAWIDLPRVIAASEQAYEYPMVDLEPLPRWSVGRVTLLGDAAHAMYPFGSNGASQSIIDARILAQELATRPDPITALAAYEERRRSVTAEVQHANRRQAGEVMAQVGALARAHATGRAQDALMAVEERYRRLAGFDAETLNRRASYGVS